MTAMTTTTISPAVRFSKILVAMDFTDVADSGLAYAKSLARAFDSELLLVHVTDPIAHINIPEGGWVDDSARIKNEMEATESLGAALRAEGFRAKETCAFGGVAHEIAERCRERQADLIVTGTHGRYGLNRILFGSEAENIARVSTIPILVVGPKATPMSKPRWQPQCLVCVVRLDKRGAEIAALAHQFADEQKAKLQTVCMPFYDAQDEAEGFRNFKNRSKELLSPMEAETTSPAVLPEPAGESLVDLAIARNADLLIFDQRSRLLGLTRWSGGFLPRLFALAPCPVLVMPSPSN
jgi:nucleotide-binding universal stress UspA family protein